VSAEQSSWIRDVTEADFQREVIDKSHEKPVVVDFWAEWCDPCRQLGPLIERLVNERKGEIILAKVDVDQAKQLASEFGIEGIPMVLAFRAGQLVLSFKGLLPEAQIRSFLDRIGPSEADRAAQQARQQETANPAEAEKLYRRALELDPNHDASLLGLARVLIARNQDAEATELLDGVTPGGERGAELDGLRGMITLRGLATEFGNEADLRRKVDAEPNSAEPHYQLGCILGAGGKYKEALEEMLAAARADKKLAGSKVKEAMVQIFHIIGVRSELADEYRDLLTRLLY
jgi:putative thioredoxin